MSGSRDEMLFLRDLAHRMSQGIEVRGRKSGLFHYHDTFEGQDALEWLVADPKSGISDMDGAMQMGQRLIDAGYVVRVTREFRKRHFGREKIKREFRGGASFYRFDRLRISPYHLHVVVMRARNLRSMDLLSENDPYVKLRMGAQRGETNVQYNNNNPEWKEHFVFGVDNVEAEQLHMAVCDYDSLKNDDLVGVCQLGLSDLPMNDSDASLLSEFDDLSAGADSERGSPLGLHMPSSLADVPGALSHIPGVSVAADAAAAATAAATGRRSTVPNTPSSNRNSLSGGSTPKHKEASARRRPSSSFLFRRSSSGDSLSGGGGDGNDDNDDSANSSSGSLGGDRRGGGRPLARRQSAPLVPTSATGSTVSKIFFRRGSGEAGSSDNGSSHGPAGSGGNGVAITGEEWEEEEEGLQWFPLHHPQDMQPSKRKSRRLGKSKGDDEEGDKAKSAGEPESMGLLGCRVWINSFHPRTLQFQGVSKVNIHFRVWEIRGVTSAEERHHIAVHPKQVKNRVVMMLNKDRVSTSNFPKDKNNNTLFDGSLACLTTKANQATDMLKFVVYQKTLDSVGEKAVATITMPLRVAPVMENTPAPDPGPAEGGGGSFHGNGFGGDSSHKDPSGHRSPELGGRKSSRTSVLSIRRGSWHEKREDGSGGAAAERVDLGYAPGTAPWETGLEPNPKWYRNQTLAGLLTSKTMLNGYLKMSVWVTAGGEDILDEEYPDDKTPVKGEAMEVPEPLSTICIDKELPVGFRRLRRAFLGEDSKLLAAYDTVTGATEKECSSWETEEGEPGDQERLTGCKRVGSYMIPKSAMVAANRAREESFVLQDEPNGFVEKVLTYTPEVMYGNTFHVVVQTVLTKVGPNKCRLNVSSEVDFTKTVNGIVKGQIVAGVAKGTKESFSELLGLIEAAISGGSKKPKAAKSSGFPACNCLLAVAAALAVLALAALAAFSREGGTLQASALHLPLAHRWLGPADWSPSSPTGFGGLWHVPGERREGSDQPGQDSGGGGPAGAEL